MLRNMARLHRCIDYFSFIWDGQQQKNVSLHILLLFRLRSHLKNSCIGSQQGFQTPRNNKSTRPAASCFHLFLGVWNPWWNPCTRFWYITWNLPIVAYHHPNNLSVIFVRAQLPETHNCDNKPGPLLVLFSATAVNAPHAPILTTVYIETAVSENFLSNSSSVSHMLLTTFYSGLTQASIRGIAQMQSLPFR